MTTTVGVRRAVEDDAPIVTAVLAEAFQRDPVSAWLFPHAEERARLHPRFFRPFVRDAMRVGQVWLHDNAFGAILTYPPGVQSGDVDEELAQGCGPHYERVRLVFDELGQHHPAERDHLYIPFVAVVPNQQGTGVGRTLRCAVLATCDQDKSPAYLEASSQRSRSLFERLGFYRTGEPVQLPGGPELWPMWREPYPQNDEDES